MNIHAFIVLRAVVIALRVSCPTPHPPTVVADRNRRWHCRVITPLWAIRHDYHLPIMFVKIDDGIAVSSSLHQNTHHTIVTIETVAMKASVYQHECIIQQYLLMSSSACISSMCNTTPWCMVALLNSVFMERDGKYLRPMHGDVK